MTYDHWKTTEPDTDADLPEEGSELDELYTSLAQSKLQIETLHNEIARLRTSHAALIKAAKQACEMADFRGNSGDVYNLRAAIRAAEEVAS